MAASSNKRMKDLLTDEDISKVLDIEDVSDVFSEESDDFWFDTSEEDSEKDSDTSSVVHESEPCEEVSDFSQTFVPHSAARPRFAFLGVSGVNVDFEDETSVLECFQKFIDEDMWQLFAEQTNIYANQFLAANPNLKPRSRARSWVDTNPTEMKTLTGLLIKGRTSLGNKAFYANQDLFKSKLLTTNSKLRMYKTLVRPMVSYACETWVLKENIKTKLRVFERKVLRKIYGPTKEKDGTWRIKSNEELNRLTGNKNIMNYIKAQRLAWFGHVRRMPDNSMVKKVYEWSPALTRSLGRPKNRWEDDVKSDITRLKITNWKDCIRNQTKWKKLVEKAKTSLKL